MNHSFYSVDRTTHLKIVVIALIGATAIAGIGIAAHAAGSRNDRAESGHAGIVKAGSPAMVASAVQFATR
jgi:hypothetical protein